MNENNDKNKFNKNEKEFNSDKKELKNESQNFKIEKYKEKEDEKEKKNEYNSKNIKIFFTQGVIPNIFTQLLNSFEDSYGIILGKYKKLKIEKSVDSNSNLQENQINIIINKIIFIFDKNYLSKNQINIIIKKIEENEEGYSILGKKFFVEI
jgi:hypothetical protein